MDLMVQTMTVEQAEAFEYNILDLTKIWSPHSKVGLSFARSHQSHGN
jgi:catalase